MKLQQLLYENEQQVETFVNLFAVANSLVDGRPEDVFVLSYLPDEPDDIIRLSFMLPDMRLFRFWLYVDEGQVRAVFPGDGIVPVTEPARFWTDPDVIRAIRRQVNSQ